MDFDELMQYFQDLGWRVEKKHGVKDDLARELCFLSAFSFAMLHYGHGFPLDKNFTAVETMSYEGVDLKVRAGVCV